MTNAELKAAIDAAVREVLPELVSQVAQTASEGSQELAEARTYEIRHPEDPASRRQRGKIAQLTGVYPNDTTGYPGLTKADASAAIESLLAGSPWTFNGQTLNPS